MHEARASIGKLLGQADVDIAMVRTTASLALKGDDIVPAIPVNITNPAKLATGAEVTMANRTSAKSIGVTPAKGTSNQNIASSAA